MTKIQDYKKTGIAIFKAGEIFTKDEVDMLSVHASTLPEEHVIVGDAGEPNDVYVGRVKIDRAGEWSRIVPGAAPMAIIEILLTKHHIFTDLFGYDMHLRRCQVNRLGEGAFIGRHLDAVSNPTYHAAVVIQLSKDYDGGEFAIYPEGAKKPIVKKTGYGDVVVTRCDVEHEVFRVKGGQRISLVYFYSEFGGVNPRADLVESKLAVGG
ncbi:2OG-Fe(II) oxygenase [Alphaproteobacteria bacterium LSUCC0684]|jgi:hypothetical protein